jgi:hypothetical protein
LYDLVDEITLVFMFEVTCFLIHHPDVQFFILTGY